MNDRKFIVFSVGFKRDLAQGDEIRLPVRMHLKGLTEINDRIAVDILCRRSLVVNVGNGTSRRMMT